MNQFLASVLLLDIVCLLFVAKLVKESELHEENEEFQTDRDRSIWDQL